MVSQYYYLTMPSCRQHTHMPIQHTWYHSRGTNYTQFCSRLPTFLQTTMRCQLHNNIHKDKLYIYTAGKNILQGEQSNQANKLWKLNLQQSGTKCHSLNSVIDAPTIAERIKFYHASLWSPVLQTLCQAIDAGFLTTFPELTLKQIRRNPPRLDATAKGHMNAQRSNLRSTNSKIKLEQTNKQCNSNSPIHRSTHCN